MSTATAGVEFEVGERLRALREAFGLSQRALARQSGVANGLISMIELNRTSPSVATLKKILDGIPMTLADFFTGNVPTNEEQVIYRAEELVEIADRTTGAAFPQAEPVADGDKIVAMQELARGVPIAGHVTEYAARLLRATHPDDPLAPDAIRQYVRYGASPRGMQAMILAGKITALLDERYNVAFDDLRQAARPALRHRLILNFEAQAEGISTDEVIVSLLEAVQPEIA